MAEIRASLDGIGAVLRQEESELEVEVFDEYGRLVDTSTLMSNLEIDDNKTSNIASKADGEDLYDEEIGDGEILFSKYCQEQIEMARRDTISIKTSTPPKAIEGLAKWRPKDHSFIPDLDLDPALKAILAEKLGRWYEFAVGHHVLTSHS
jgi:hypothetical protein